MLERIARRFFSRKPSELYIHIGPGKTGTSVIQYWSVLNRRFLKRNGIYYPNHNVDSNGVSGGHDGLFFDKCDKVKWDINKNKAYDFIADYKSQNYPVTLISNERYYLYIDELVEIFPDAKFIFYIRSTLENLESRYNQRVKRKGISIPIQEDIGNYDVRPYESLLTGISKHGREKFIVRLYDRNLFPEGNILYDFYSIFNLSKLPKIIRKTINSSYSFEALEFKRWINQFDLDNHYGLTLDPLLQRYPSGDCCFSIIPPKDYVQYKAKIIDDLEELLLDLNFSAEEINTYISLQKAKKQKPYRKQILSPKQKAEVWNYIKEMNYDLYTNLASLTKSASVAA
jgi:hypothetical protein